MKFQPLHNYVLVKPLSEDEMAKIEMKSAGIIIVPSTLEKRGKTVIGDVIAVGPGKWFRNTSANNPIYSVLSQMSVKEGDRVIFSEYDGNEVIVESTNYYAVRDEFIISLFIQEKEIKPKKKK